MNKKKKVDKDNSDEDTIDLEDSDDGGLDTEGVAESLLNHMNSLEIRLHDIEKLLSIKKEFIKGEKLKDDKEVKFKEIKPKKK